jgi:hypothetical protein
VRIPSTESLRFPEEGSSAQGKSGPKPRPKGVGDGQQVEIPVPPTFVCTMGGRRRVENRATGSARPSSEAEGIGKSVPSYGQAVTAREI